MNGNLLWISTLSSILFIGCTGSPSNYNTSYPAAKPITFNGSANNAQPSIFTNSNNAGVTGSSSTIPNIAVQPAITAGTATVNPAHGQPGHRCDLAVGAPLTAAAMPVQQTTPVAPAQTLPVATTPAATVNPTVKSNPAHGQPGHRCDIAVGAPLNSPAIKAQPTATVTPTATSTLAKPANTAGATGKLNPAHGQPGHRCDIAVGAPLASAAKQTPTAPAVKQTSATQEAAPVGQEISSPGQLFPSLPKPADPER
jgi:hypothetical protein